MNAVKMWNEEGSGLLLLRYSVLRIVPKTSCVGILVDSEIDLSTRYGKVRVFINKTLSTETAYQQDLNNRDRLSL
jgi:hypothetical protein